MFCRNAVSIFLCLTCIHVLSNVAGCIDQCWSVSCEGIVPLKDYVMAEHLIINDSLHAAGMQGQPQSLDDMTDGQIENRFYQSVVDLLYVSWCLCSMHELLHY